MNVKDRIEQAPACEVINLTEVEKNLYTGAGWKLARFTGGELVEFFDPSLLDDPDGDGADGAIRAAIAWLKQIDSGNSAKSYTNGERDGGEAWLVMCSCYQLCEPRRITLTDASALAHMARVFGEAFANG